MARLVLFRALVGLSVVWVVLAVWTVLGRSRPFEVEVIDDLGQPVARAVISWEETPLGTTNSRGQASVQWQRGVEGLTISAPGFQSLNLNVTRPPQDPLEAVITASFLRGQIVDNEAQPLPGAYVTTGSQTSLSDEQGRYAVRNAEPGPVKVWRPGWESLTFEWDGTSGQAAVAIEPEMLKAVHIGGEAAGESWSTYLELVERTELNAVILDLKDESGVVYFDSENATAAEVAALYPSFSLDDLVSEAHAEDVYVIGRIVTFQDPIAAIALPEVAVWDTASGAPYQANGQYFLDPTDPEAQAYAIELASEACASGVDEIQFDYVRFPDNRSESARFDGGVSAEVRVATVRDFLATAVAALHPLGCAVAADIFGFITSAVDDGGIGQQWEELTNVVDVASPMLYPSHYASGWYGYQVPADHPGPLVAEALDDALSRLSREIVVRPWLQDFNYTPNQVRAQIDEAESRGLGWMLWNAQSVVSEAALRPES
ncbi:MAG: putative glycoside hydrolase [Acidimicrobiia bacterium]|nr:hypothetical protein [Acidimicrobiia bacterium]MDQ3500514.1 hypothetical protein [Actinomycetota bacterium]